MPFLIDRDHGTLYINGSLDFELLPVHKFEVIATDSNPTHPKQSSVNVTVQVTDANDHFPMFFNYQRLRKINGPNDNLRKFAPSLRFNEAVPVYEKIFHNFKQDDEVIRIYSNDSDSGFNAEVKLEILNSDLLEYFYMEEETGAIRLSRDFPFYDSQRFEIYIKASDDGSPVRESYAVVLLTSQVRLRPTTTRITTTTTTTTTTRTTTVTTTTTTSSVTKPRAVIEKVQKQIVQGNIQKVEKVRRKFNDSFYNIGCSFTKKLYCTLHSTYLSNSVLKMVYII